jgi:flavin-dependent dehydrogenase
MLPIAVIGGGPAGSVCARQLAHKGHRVVLFEKRLQPDSRAGETCSPRVRRLIEEICGASMPADASAPLSSFYSAWGHPAWESRSLDFWQAGHGATIDRAALDSWLLQLACDAGVLVHRGYKVVSGRCDNGCWIVRAKNGPADIEAEAEFVIEATGAAARSPVVAGAGRIFTDRLVSVSAELPGAPESKHDAGVEAVAQGWWFSAARSEGCRTASFFTDADMLPAAEDLKSWFLCELGKTAHVKHLTERNVLISTARVTAARTSIRRQLWKDSWIAIGDAARTVDPLSGGGVGRAVEDGLRAADAVSQRLLGMDRDGLRSFVLDSIAHFREQTALQHRFYAQENRWPAHPFWSRRSQFATSTPLAASNDYSSMKQFGFRPSHFPLSTQILK